MRRSIVVYAVFFFVHRARAALQAISRRSLSFVVNSFM